jgi:ketosteroid isomerase-like protein
MGSGFLGDTASTMPKATATPGPQETENVGLVRRTLEAVARRDYQEASRCFHSDAVWHNTREFPGPSTCVGPQEIVDFLAALQEPFDAPSRAMGIERVAESGDRVVVGVHSVGKGKSSGLPVDVHWGAVFQVRDGHISQVDVYGDWGRAHAAAGLDE